MLFLKSVEFKLSKVLEEKDNLNESHLMNKFSY